MIKNVDVSRWIFTEAQTGKTLLDTHYSFLNKNFQAYVEDYNDILVEDDIVKDISFNGGISGTTSVLDYAENIYGSRAFKKINYKIRPGERETHEGRWKVKFGGSHRVIKCEFSRNDSTALTSKVFKQ